MKTTIACCVCGSTDAADARLWRTAGDNLLGGDARYAAVRCARCGTVRLDPRPADLTPFYAPETYARAEDDGSEIGKRLDAFNDGLADRAVAETASPGRVLDIGCGDGRFLAAMARRGWAIEGLETDPVAATLARRRTNSTIHAVPVEDADLPENAFDLVTLLHVLEHVPDPRVTLAAAFRIVRPGGALRIALPNVASLEAHLFGAAWYHLDLPRHLWGFTPRGLTRLVEEAGFSDAIGLRYLPFLFAPQSLRNALRRGKSVPSGSSGDSDDGGSKRTRLFRTLLRLSDALGRTLPGEIMELSARKPNPTS